MASHLAVIGLVGPLAIAPAFANTQPVQTRFTCLTQNNVPATVALTSRGPVPVINWHSTLGSGQFTPQVRCDIVSKKFQQFYADGTLNFLTTGEINGQPVICVAQSKDSSCHRDLFTLKSRYKARQTLQHLQAVRVGSAGPLNESAGGEVYIDMAKLLEVAPVDPTIVVPGAATVESEKTKNEATPTQLETTNRDSPESVPETAPPSEVVEATIEQSVETEPPSEAPPQKDKPSDLW